MLTSTVLLLLGATAAIAAPATKEFVQRDYQDNQGGMATWYSVTDPKQNEGHIGEVACDDANYTDGEEFVALGEADYQGGAACGKKSWIWDPSSRNLKFATVKDSCSGCKPGHIDLSIGLRDSLHAGSDTDHDQFDVNWGWAQ